MKHKRFTENTLLIASSNSGKIKEIAKLLTPYNITIRSTKEFDLEAPEENGTSFKENALIKAKYYSQQTNLPALADDSGLVIPNLNGDPGIYSARWAGESGDFSIAMKRIHQELKTKYGKDHPCNDPAYFTCALTLYWPEDQQYETFEGMINGHLQFPPSGNKGFGYDPIFIPKGHTSTFADLPSEIKQSTSHRANAFNLMITHCFQ